MAVAEVPNSLVEQLRQQMLREISEKGQNVVHPKDYERIKTDDHWLRRFLAHNEQNLELTVKMMWTSLTWRKDLQVNDINESNIKMDIIIKGAFFPHGKDINGRTILVFKCKMHSKGTVDMDELKRCIIYWFERLERMTKGEPISIFFDMEGCGLSNMDMDLVKYLIGLFKEYYPFFLNYIIIYEMAWILSAAFKIVKSWLPEKAIEKLKMVNKKDVHTFVPKTEALKCWGGDNDYVFSFIPEDLSQTRKGTSENSMGNGGASMKKVHFLDGSPMSEQPSKDSESKDDGPLSVVSGGIITFVREGPELVSTLELQNTDPTNEITYKLKTTSPEKFRVKPSMGYLKSGGKVTVTVTLLPGFQLGGLSKDKFLVMSSVVEDSEVATLDLSELWKATGNRKVYQTRLRCVQSGEVTRNGSLIMNHSSPSSDNDGLSKMTNTLAKIADNQLAQHESLHRLQYIQIGQFILTLLLGITMLYVLYSDRSSFPNENAYCKNPNAP